MATGSHLSIITLNINGLNTPIKTQRLAELLQKQDHYIYCLQEMHLQMGYIQNESEGLEKDIPYKQRTKKEGVAILTHII